MDFHKTIKLGGVPEHFNHPWKLWLHDNNGEFQNHNLLWQDFPSGSAAMIQALEADQIDVAFVLTEAIANAQMKGSQIVPLSVFVKSPLIWEIFSSIENPIDSVAPIAEKKYAISRFGSGSDLMARVDAKERGEKISDQNWVIVNNLDGARKALTKLEADLFFWEKWMTKPFVDLGELKMIDERATPWPCFVMVCNPTFTKISEKINVLKEAYSEVLKLANFCKFDPAFPQELSKKYGILEEDAKSWLRHVEWASDWISPDEAISKARQYLRSI